MGPQHAALIEVALNPSRVMRVENDPGLERVTFDSVWRLLPKATQVQTTCPESLSIPFLLTLVHEWLLPKV